MRRSLNSSDIPLRYTPSYTQFGRRSILQHTLLRRALRTELRWDIKLLVENRSDMNARDNKRANGNTPLYWLLESAVTSTYRMEHPSLNNRKEHIKQTQATIRK